MGRYSINIVGESKYQDAIAFARAGNIVELIHEPDNRFDPRAIKVVLWDATIGYIERDSWVTRALIDEHTDMFAQIEAVTGGSRGKPQKGIVLVLFTAIDAEEARKAAALRLDRKRGCFPR